MNEPSAGEREGLHVCELIALPWSQKGSRNAVLLVATVAATMLAVAAVILMDPVQVDSDGQGALSGLAGQLAGLAARGRVSIGYENVRRNSCSPVGNRQWIGATL